MLKIFQLLGNGLGKRIAKDRKHMYFFAQGCYWVDQTDFGLEMGVSTDKPRLQPQIRALV